VEITQIADRLKGGSTGLQDLQEASDIEEINQDRNNYNTIREHF
jgi:hypothetical protein